MSILMNLMWTVNKKVTPWSPFSTERDLAQPRRGIGGGVRVGLGPASTR